MAHKHTGPIVHEDMTSIMHHKGKKDRHASGKYHEENAKHGMKHGHMPADDSDKGEHGQGTIPNTAGNCEMC